jgi:D-sedoheptulose 7-phosphate isomerase
MNFVQTSKIAASPGGAAEFFNTSARAIDDCISNEMFLGDVENVAGSWLSSLKRGGKILLAGNGGSAADAQHIAGEIVSRFYFDRPALAGVALTTDTSVITAISNDYGYERVFERQVLALGGKDDVFVGISTSGKSPNILRALAAARSLGMATVGFTGESGGNMVGNCDICLRAPSSSTPLIQQIHITAAHAICAIVERGMFIRDHTN